MWRSCNLHSETARRWSILKIKFHYAHGRGAESRQKSQQINGTTFNLPFPVQRRGKRANFWLCKFQFQFITSINYGEFSSYSVFSVSETSCQNVIILLNKRQRNGTKRSEVKLGGNILVIYFSIFLRFSLLTLSLRINILQGIKWKLVADACFSNILKGWKEKILKLMCAKVFGEDFSLGISNIAWENLPSRWTSWLAMQDTCSLFQDGKLWWKSLKCNFNFIACQRLRLEAWAEVVEMSQQGEEKQQPRDNDEIYVLPQSTFA